MIYKLLGHPSLWFFFTGIFLGGIIAILPPPPRRCKDPLKYRAGRVAKIFLFLTGAVAAGTVALFLSGSAYPVRFLPAVLVGLVLAALGLRFKRAAGIPLLVLCAAALILGSMALAGWELVQEGEVVCHAFVLSAEGDEASLSVKALGGAEAIVHAPAANLRVQTKFLSIHPAYPFFGSLPFYRIIAVLAEGRDYELASGELAVKEETLLALPGVYIKTFETNFPSLQRFFACELVIAPDTPEPYFRGQ